MKQENGTESNHYNSNYKAAPSDLKFAFPTCTPGKLKLSYIKPVVMCESETWVLTQSINANMEY